MIEEVRPIQSPVFEHWSAMVLAARPVVGSFDEACDCASEAVLQYLERQPQDVLSLEALLVTIAKRRAIDHVRARERARLRDDRVARAGALSAPDLAEDVAARAEAFWVDAQARRLLQPRVYRLLTLIADGVPMPEAARQLDMTERAAQSHLLRARRVVRAALARTLAALGIGWTALRRASAPAGVTTAALALAVVVSGEVHPAPPVDDPAFVLMPGTGSDDVPASESLAGLHLDRLLALEVAPVRNGAVPGVSPAYQPVVSAQTPLVGARVERRDDGHHSDGPVEQVVWCLEHLRVELHYQGCDTPSGQQRTGEMTREGPLVPAVG